MPTLLDTSAALTIDEIRTIGEFAELGPEWNSLWERCPGATPFQSPEWLLPWWRHFGNEGLWAITLRKAGRLVGFAPFFIYTNLARGIRQVTLVGNGISDHLDVLLDPEIESDGASVIMSHLAEHRADWTACDFRDLPAGCALLSGPRPEVIEEEIAQEDPCPTIALRCSEKELAGPIPPKVLHKLRYYRRRAEQMGDVRFDVVGDLVDSVATETILQHAFDTLLALHHARWAERREPSTLDDPRVQAFHRDVIGRLLARGWLRFYTLHIGGNTAAAYYGFLAKGRAYAYLGGFDPAFQPVAPGRLILLHAMTEAMREGAREFDFLRGREPYKYVWGAVDRPQYRLRLRLGAR